MQELAVTWQRAVRIWWRIVWRASLGSFVFGAIAGAVIGGIEGVMGLSRQTIQASGAVVGVLVGAIWGLAVVGVALRKRYTDFRLALVPHNSD
jgi:outer membrane lipoprotein SlyB